MVLCRGRSGLNNALVPHADLTSAEWADRTDGSARCIALSIANRHDLRLTEIRWHEYAGRRQRVALFDRAGTAFALVPGGRAGVGYDGGRFVPSAEQAASYEYSANEYGLPPVGEFVDGMTSPPRTVEFPALLVAVQAVDPCGSDISPDDPRVRDLLAQSGARAGSGVIEFRQSGDLEVLFDATGHVRRARMLRQVSYDEAVHEVARTGLRLASPDEWEYACGAGQPTLFRWGDDNPCAGYPYDHRLGPHREPNLWGLAIGQDPYRHEWTSRRGILCGGDGGSATRGGTDFFLGWLTLATAYRDMEFGAWLNSGDGYVDEILVRPVIDVA